MTAPEIKYRVERFDGEESLDFPTLGEAEEYARFSDRGARVYECALIVEFKHEEKITRIETALFDKSHT